MARAAATAGPAWKNDPAETLKRRLWAGLCFVFGEKWFRDRVPWQEVSPGQTDVPAWAGRAYAIALLGGLLGMLLLGFVGWRWTYAWRREALPSSLAAGWLPLPYLLSHAEALHGPRLPFDGILLCYAAYALTGFLHRPEPAGRTAPQT